MFLFHLDVDFSVFRPKKGTLKFHEFISAQAYFRDKSNTKEWIGFYSDDNIYINMQRSGDSQGQERFFPHPRLTSKLAICNYSTECSNHDPSECTEIEP